ncbi:hypothetical protein C8Q73DRAFT_538987 [Cubamyces lactineus]|nr:hypothetical protein C8Q73DRAFT_538987 [Cubamyces lactineus]
MPRLGQIWPLLLSPVLLYPPSGNPIPAITPARSTKHGLRLLSLLRVTASSTGFTIRGAGHSSSSTVCCALYVLRMGEREAIARQTWPERTPARSQPCFRGGVFLGPVHTQRRTESPNQAIRLSRAVLECCSARTRHLLASSDLVQLSLRKRNPSWREGTHSVKYTPESSALRPPMYDICRFWSSSYAP